MERNFYRIKAVLEFDDKEKEVIKKYGKSSTGNIERTFTVDGAMPLISLHYTLTKVFGFINEHLHCFRLFDDDFSKTIKNTPEWREKVGILFKSPTRDEYEDFWCDDYKSGSFNNWRKRKYSYPYPSYKGFYPTYKSWQDNLNSYIDDCNDEFYVNRFEGDYYSLIVAPLKYTKFKRNKDNIFHFNDISLECIEYLFEHDIKNLLDTITIEEIYHNFKRLIYNYDYGDNWIIKLEINEENDSFILEQAENSKLPILISYEGYNMVEDVGSTSGYAAFLLTLFNLKEINANDCEDDIIEVDNHFYKWVDPNYKTNNIDLTPNKIYRWANSLEWDYRLKDIGDWFK